MRTFFPILLVSVIFFCFTGKTHQSKPTIANWQTEMLDAVNKLRKKGCRCPNGKYYAATQPLVWDELLAKAAQQHAEDMDHQNYFDHKSKDGRTFSDRITSTGYNWRAAAENIAWNYESAQGVVMGWQKSSGHCRNLMNPAYTEMGAGLAGDYWVQDLGSKK